MFARLDLLLDFIFEMCRHHTSVTMQLRYSLRTAYQSTNFTKFTIRTDIASTKSMWLRTFHSSCRQTLQRFFTHVARDAFLHAAGVELIDEEQM